MLTLANAMCGTRRLNWRQAFAYPRALVFLPLLSLLTGCVAAAAGAGAAVAFGGAAALTSSCYDRVSLRLTDAQSGQIACAARVPAVNDAGSELVFRSCFHAAVPRGAWTVRAELPGYTTASTPLVVPVTSHCEPAVQTIELTIAPVGYRPLPPQPVVLPPRPAVSATPSASVSTPPPVPSPAAPPVSAAPPASVAPPASAAPPTGAFPAPPAP